MRVATYTRISTDEDHQPFSLGAQMERLNAYTRSQDGWRIVRHFEDKASGATLDRTGLQQALAEAQRVSTSYCSCSGSTGFPETSVSSCSSQRNWTTSGLRIGLQPSHSKHPRRRAR